MPIGEYAAVALLLFFGLKSIKDAWDLPANAVQSGDKSSPELDEYVEAEVLVKKKVTVLFHSLPVMGLHLEVHCFPHDSGRLCCV